MCESNNFLETGNAGAGTPRLQCCFSKLMALVMEVAHTHPLYRPWPSDQKQSVPRSSLNN